MNQSPEDIPPIDPRVVADLEAHAKRVADSLDVMMNNLKTNLHKVHIQRCMKSLNNYHNLEHTKLLAITCVYFSDVFNNLLLC